jgi:glycosyltransferase involved in cell wall biosynthesis
VKPGAKLLLFINEPSYIFSHRLPLLRAAARAGYDVHVVSPPVGADAARLRAERLTAHAIPLGRGLSGPVALLKGVLALDRVIRQVRPDILHCLTMKQVVIGGIVGSLRGVPRLVYSLNGLGFMFTGHGLQARTLRAVVQPLLKRLLRSPRAQTIVQNVDDFQQLLDEGYCRREHLALTRGSGVDTDAFVPSEPPRDPVRVLLGARIIGEKGVREFVEASRLLAARGVRAEFLLAGMLDPFNPTAIDEKTIRLWEAEGLVRWLGIAPDMPALLRSVHIACLPSYREGLPKFIAEAAASGLPAVSCDVVGCRAAVQHGVSGFLVPVRDAAALADALALLIGDADLRRRMGAAAREFALAQFGQEHIASAVLDVYERAPEPG